MKKCRLLSLILAVIMLISCLTACGGGGSKSYSDDSEKQVTLRYAFSWTVQEDLEMVNDELNKLLEKKFPNTKIELVCDDLANKWQLWMAGDTVVDLANIGLDVKLYEEITKRSFIGMNDLIEEYAPTVKKEREEMYPDQYLTGEYNGELYGIPCVQYHTKETVALRISQSVYSYFDVAKIVDITHNNVRTPEEFYETLDAGLLAAKADGKLTQLNIDELYSNNICKRGYTFIGGENSNICFDTYSDEVKIMDFHQTEEFKLWIKWMHKWYEDGFISKDVLTGTSLGASNWAGDLSGVITTRFGADENWIVAPTSGTSDPYTIILDDPENDILSSHNVGSLMTYTCIPTTSENPARAMRFIEFLRTEEGREVLEMIAYGIEGTHYERLSDNLVKAYDYAGQGTSNSKYGIPAWMIGNEFNFSVIYPYTEERFEYAKEYYEKVRTSAKKNDMFGYCFDQTPVDIKMSNILAVNKELEVMLTSGVIADYEATYKQMNDKIAAAGLQDVLDEFQKQADEYIKSK